MLHKSELFLKKKKRNFRTSTWRYRNMQVRKICSVWVWFGCHKVNCQTTCTNHSVMCHWIFLKLALLYSLGHLSKLWPLKHDYELDEKEMSLDEKNVIRFCENNCTFVRGHYVLPIPWNLGSLESLLNNFWLAMQEKAGCFGFSFGGAVFDLMLWLWDSAAALWRVCWDHPSCCHAECHSGIYLTKMCTILKSKKNSEYVNFLQISGMVFNDRCFTQWNVNQLHFITWMQALV